MEEREREKERCNKRMTWTKTNKNDINNNNMRWDDLTKRGSVMTTTQNLGAEK